MQHRGKERAGMDNRQETSFIICHDIVSLILKHDSTQTAHDETLNGVLSIMAHKYWTGRTRLDYPSLIYFFFKNLDDGSVLRGNVLATCTTYNICDIFFYYINKKKVSFYTKSHIIFNQTFREQVIVLLTFWDILALLYHYINHYINKNSV